MGQGAGLEELLARHGFGECAQALHRLSTYRALLEKWNVRVNLTASTEWAALSRLFEEALWAARWYPRHEVDHLDIGSGAGFPALPLKILRPSMRLVMLESRARRAAFLETACAALGLSGTGVVCRRAEDYLRSPEARGFDIVSWKALKLSRAALRLLVAHGREGSRAWLFHGAEIPLERAREEPHGLRLLQREAFPGRAGHWLSIYVVSRETCAT